ncbi:MAG TPA: hypothetical protein VI893_03870 [Thermoplasmata archaeon]|nr:hypothetical protein [Thermoplasmata archaeon]
MDFRLVIGMPLLYMIILISWLCGTNIDVCFSPSISGPKDIPGAEVIIFNASMWAIFFGLVFIFFAFPKGREDWEFALGETLMMLVLIIIAWALISLMVYVALRLYNTDVRPMLFAMAAITPVLLFFVGLLIRTHKANSLMSYMDGGGGGGMWWEHGYGEEGGGGAPKQEWGVKDVEQRYGKGAGWSTGAHIDRPKK